MSKTMKAVQIPFPGGPEVLKVTTVPLPTPTQGQIRIHIRAFGTNRSELFTRQGHSPGIAFPRIPGIECAGTVDSAPGGEFSPGDVVVTCMGGMGRVFDGGYAEYTVVPAAQVRKINVTGDVPWEVLGAVPETMQTAWGSLHRSLRIEKGERLLVRGGTTGVGLAAVGLAKAAGLSVVATTRNAARAEMLRRHGADDVVVDDGEIAGVIGERYPGGVDKVLELVGPETVVDSAKCLKEHGIVCVSGVVGGAWDWQGLLMGIVPKARYLTTYGGGYEELMMMPLDDIIEDILSGRIYLPVGKVMHIDDIVEVHRLMESNEAGGKIVVLT